LEKIGLEHSVTHPQLCNDSYYMLYALYCSCIGTKALPVLTVVIKEFG